MTDITQYIEAYLPPKVWEQLDGYIDLINSICNFRRKTSQAPTGDPGRLSTTTKDKQLRWRIAEHSMV